MGHNEIKGMQQSLGISPEKEWGFDKDSSFVWIYKHWNDQNVRTHILSTLCTSVFNGDMCSF